MSHYYVGLSTSGHDPSFSIVDESGKVLFAEATERYLQDKRAWGCLPDHKAHIESIINEIIEQDNDAKFKIATSWKSIKAELPVEVSDILLPAKIVKWVESLQALVQRNSGIHSQMIAKERVLPTIAHYDHHLCHATAALYFAPMDNAICLVLDGEGEVGASSLFEWDEGKLKRVWRSWSLGSLGTFYAALTQLCGFNTVEGEEWKVMGLAAYGKVDDKLVDLLKQIIFIENGKPMLGVDNNLPVVMDELKSLSRKKSDPITDAADMAASGQFVYSQLVNEIISKFAKEYKNLILTGGCALNSSYNGTILNNHSFNSVHVPPAPADDGNSLGAAIQAWKENHPEEPLPFNNKTPFLGTKITTKDLKNLVNNSGLATTKIDDNDTDFIAKKLADGYVIGVMRGKAEFGPRALGNRSILADPRQKEMKEKINTIVKGREAYRPFAPVVPLKDMHKWFENPQTCLYMSFTLKWREDVKHLIPSVIHHDGTGRVQSIQEETYPWLFRLTQSFEKITGIPILLNTSFNVMGKPIVHSVNDAISVLHTTALDAVLIENIFIEKSS